MKAYYFPKTPLGEFFYNPASHEGVAISGDGILVVGMNERFDPAQEPSYLMLPHRECEIDDDVFSRLVDSALRYTAAERDLREALSHFLREPVPH